MPVSDLRGSAAGSTFQFVDLRWAGFFPDVVGALQGASERDGGAVDLVDASNGFLAVPGGAYLAVGITGVEEATEAGSAPVADPFVGCGEEASYPIQRVSFKAPVPQGFVLDSATSSSSR